jgi:hypothetical protein
MSFKRSAITAEALKLKTKANIKEENRVFMRYSLVG